MTRRVLALAAGLVACMAVGGWVAPVGQGGSSLPPRGLTVEPAPVHGNTGRAPANPPGLRDDLARARARETHWRAEAARWRHVALHQPDVQAAIRAGAIAYGLDYPSSLARASCETGGTFRADAQGPDGAGGRPLGLYQFKPGTFASTPYAAIPGGVWDPYVASLAHGWMVREGRGGEWACRGPR